jgi:hypothetical protein
MELEHGTTCRRTRGRALVGLDHERTGKVVSYCSVSLPPSSLADQLTAKWPMPKRLTRANSLAVCVVVCRKAKRKESIPGFVRDVHTPVTAVPDGIAV